MLNNKFVLAVNENKKPNNFSDFIKMVKMLNKNHAFELVKELITFYPWKAIHCRSGKTIWNTVLY